MNAWPLIAGIMYYGLRIVTGTRVRVIDEGGRAALEHSEPFIIAANHQSHADTAVLFHSIPRSCRPRVRFVASRERFGPLERGGGLRDRLERWFMHGLAVHAYRSILVARESGGLRTVDALAEGLRERAVLAMYPEGTRSRDGDLGPLKPGVAMLAIDAGCQVVPVRIDGTIRALPKSNRLPRLLTRIEIRFRPPIEPRPAETHAAFLERLAARLEPPAAKGAQ